jgi:hypothetical protein
MDEQKKTNLALLKFEVFGELLNKCSGLDEEIRGEDEELLVLQ